MNLIIWISLYVLGCFLVSLILNKMNDDWFNGDDGVGYIVVVLWPAIFVLFLLILVGLFLNLPVILTKYFRQNKKDNDGKQN